MPTNTTHTFRTPTGVCAISPTRIVLSPGGPGGDVVDNLITTPNRGTLHVYAAIGGLCIIYSGLLSLLPIINPLRHSTGLTRVLQSSLMIFGALLIIFMIRRRETALPLHIERRTLRSVTPHPPGDNHGGWFEAVYVVNGRYRTRRIEPLVGGWQDAMATMEAAGLIESK